MEPVEVTARFSPEGEITPLSITLDGQNWPINAGRKWPEANDWHFLVMTGAERVYELIFKPSDMRWYVKRTGGVRAVA